MKNKLTLLALALLLTIGVFAQAPEKINYQAVARNLSGIPLVNQPINVKYEIRSGSSSGTLVYAESHSLTTNQFGLFTAEVGGGTPTFGTMAGIAWGTAPFYLYVEVDGDPMGITQLLSVPYALFAKESANGPAGLPGKNSLMNITPEPAGANCSAGGNKVESGLDDNNDGTLQLLEVDYTYFVCDGVAGPTGPQGPIGLTGPAGNTGPAGANGVGIDSTVHNANGTMTIYYSNSTSYTTNDLTGPPGVNGTTYFPGNGIAFNNDTIINIGDADNNPNNELITLTNLNGNIIEITENGTLHTVDLTSILGSTYTPGNGIDITGNIISTIDNDTSATNEIQTLSVSGDTLYLSNGNSVILPSFSETITSITDNGDGTYNYTDELGLVEVINTLDADADPTNEIQDLSIVGDILTITNNGLATNIDLSPYKELPVTASTGDILQWNGSSWVAAIDAVNDADNDPNNEIELPATATTNQVLTWNGSAWIAQNPGSGADNWGSQAAVTDGLSITGDGTAGNPITLATSIPTNTSDLTNDSGFITSPNDADSDPSNELELPLIGNTLGDVLTWNGSSWVAGVAPADGDSDPNNEIELPSTATTGDILVWNGSAWVAGIDQTADGDTDATNELELPSTAGTGDLLYYNGTSWVANPTPADNDNQNLSNITSPGSVTINITGGSSTTFSIDDADSNPANELITSFGLNGTSDSLVITEAGNNHAVSLSTLIPTGKWTESGGLLYPTTLANNVGIGTNSPIAKLEVSDGVSLRPEVLLSTTAGNFRIGYRYKTALAEWSMGQGEGTGQQFRISDVQTGITPFVIEQGSGNIGVGTNSPTTSLHLNGSLRLENMSGTAPAIGSVLTSMDAQGNAEWQPIPSATNVWNLNGNSGTNSGTNFVGTTDAQNLVFRTNNIERVRITQKGQIEILNTGSSVFIGSGAGASDDLTNRQNTFVGDFSGNKTTSGNWNTALGYGALTDNITGTSNTALGRVALSYNTGSNNTATGTYSLFWGTTGSGNTATGAYAGQTNTTGSNNTYLGYNADATVNNLTNATAIGYNTQVSQSNSLILGNNANVGIGTSTPTTTFEVANSTLNTTAKITNTFTSSAQKVAVDGSATGGGAAANMGGSFAATGSTLSNYGIYANAYGNSGSKTGITSSATGTGTNIGGQFSATSGTNNYAIIVPSGGGDVGIGTSSPLFPLDVKTSTALRSAYFETNTNSASSTFGIYSTVQGTGTGAKRAGSFEAYNGSGENIGVRGYAQGSTATNYGVYGWSTGAGTTNYGVFGSATGATNNWAGYFSSGDVYVQNNLSVGTTTPIYPLHVVGNALLSANVHLGSPTPVSTSAKVSIWGSGWANTLKIYGTSDAQVMIVESAGSVGIGATINPAYNLHLENNSAAKPTTNTWTVASDARLKKDVKPFEGGLTDILKINPVWFTYTGEAGMPEDTGVGVLAQELKKIAPYMVNEWEYKKEESSKGEKYLGVDNGAMTYMLINAIKEQQKMIDDLKKEVEALKNK
ncbi:MAG: tail fiber domain-containing protein [Flavobacteriales bacterium]